MQSASYWQKRQLAISVRRLGRGKAVVRERKGHLRDISKVTMEMYRPAGVNVGYEI